MIVEKKGGKGGKVFDLEVNSKCFQLAVNLELKWRAWTCIHVVLISLAHAMYPLILLGFPLAIQSCGGVWYLFSA